jgi:hypothetical protein
MFSRFRIPDVAPPLLVQISEPWDFRVGDGVNSVLCDFVRADTGDDGERWVLRARAEVSSQAREVGTLIIAGNRHIGEPLDLAWRGGIVSASFSLVPANRETGSVTTTIGGSVPLGIGTLRLETTSA